MSRSESRKTSETLAFRLTPEDRAVVFAAAEAAGLSAPAFARRAALRAAGATSPSYERRGPRPDAAMLARILGELGRIGGNVNQIARRANAGAGTDEAAFGAAVDALRGIRTDLLAAFEEGPAA